VSIIVIHIGLQGIESIEVKLDNKSIYGLIKVYKRCNQGIKGELGPIGLT
jgi:hypothetical protein